MRSTSCARPTSGSRRRWRRFCARNNDVDVDQLMVTEAYVNEGPRMKRVRPAPMGRAYRIQRRLCHIIVQVGDRVQVGDKGEKA
jgi:Ribosomal protein L22p/L17e